MIAHNPHTSQWCEALGPVTEEIVQCIQLIIDGDTEGLEDLWEKAGGSPPVHAFHDSLELGCCGGRFSDDEGGKVHTAWELSVHCEYCRKIFLSNVSEERACGCATCSVEAEIERSGKPKGEAAVRIIDMG